MELVDPLAEKYTEKYSTRHSELLQELQEQTAAHAHAHMISSPVQGRLLAMLSRMCQPSVILEIGTFTGYSTLCLAEGLLDQGIIHTLEMREEDAKLAQSFFNRSIYQKNIKLHLGNAKELLPQIKDELDLVFIDADKTGYIEYYELTLPQLKKGGYVIADNVLFHGHVLQKELTNKSAKAIQAFNEHVANDERVEQVMLTVRDGLLLIRKL